MPSAYSQDKDPKKEIAEVLKAKEFGYYREVERWQPKDKPAEKKGERRDGSWILDIDYAVLNRIDVYVTRAGQVERHVLLGNLHAEAHDGRAPAVALYLKPGAQYTLLLRIENRGSKILPVSLSKPGAFHSAALNEQMVTEHGKPEEAAVEDEPLDVDELLSEDEPEDKDGGE